MTKKIPEYPASKAPEEEARLHKELFEMRLALTERNDELDRVESQLKQTERNRDQLADDHEFLKAKMAHLEIQLALTDLEAKEARMQAALFVIASRQVGRYAQHIHGCKWAEGRGCDCGYVQAAGRLAELNRKWDDWEEQE